MFNSFARQSLTNEQWKLVDKFDSAYWSGLNIQVYTDDIFLDEALQLNYQIVEQVRAYYSYDSYVANRLYHGTRIISGELTVNFKRDSYLFSLINLLSVNQEDIPTVNQEVQTTDVRPPLVFDPDKWGDNELEKLKNGNMDPETLMQVVRAQKAGRNTADVSKASASVKRRAGAFETRKEGFNLNVLFGIGLNASKNIVFHSDESYRLSREQTVPLEGATSAAHKALGVGTGIKLIGVSIMGVGKTVTDDGRPVLETYTFQARDLQVLNRAEIANLPKITNNPGKSKSAGEASIDNNVAK